jgi:hypothetical protein
VIVVAAFLINSLVRVYSSPAERSIGIIEELLFGKSMLEVMSPPFSENFRRFDEAAKTSAAVADLVDKYGTKGLAVSPALKEQRQQAGVMSEEAYDKATAISKDYLKASNPDLPDIYFAHFVPALDSWRRGFERGDPKLVKAGAVDYNAFVAWMQSKKPTDFKRMR